MSGKSISIMLFFIQSEKWMSAPFLGQLCCKTNQPNKLGSLKNLQVLQDSIADTVGKQLHSPFLFDHSQLI